MKVRAVAEAGKVDAHAVAVASDQLGKAKGLPSAFLKAQGFGGAVGEVVAAPAKGGGTTFYVGIGAAATVDVHAVRSAAAVVSRAAARHRSLTLDLVSGAGREASTADLTALAEGAVLGAYRFDGHRTKPSERRLGEVRVITGAGRVTAEARAAVAAGLRRAEATCLVRDLVNTPGGELTAPVFAEQAVAVSEAADVECTVHDEASIRELGLGGLIAVNRGSVVPPRFLELSWTPPGADDDTPALALVGKGITFDSGGLSMKTSEGMLIMKSDMAGGAVVLAALSACRDLGVTSRVSGYVPLTDNMTGGDAQRVGDVVVHYGGSTTEVLNTDAEGRLVLADALAWATTARDGHRVPDAVIDVATLTGACIVGLGARTAGLLADDDELADRLLDAAAGAGERLWRLPLFVRDRKDLDSKIADRKNVAGRYGGALNAALFLRDFVGAVPWAHLDIAGPAYNEGADELEVPSGGTGYGVRTLLDLLTERR